MLEQFRAPADAAICAAHSLSMLEQPIAPADAAIRAAHMLSMLEQPIAPAAAPEAFKRLSGALTHIPFGHGRKGREPLETGFAGLLDIARYAAV